MKKQTNTHEDQPWLLEVPADLKRKARSKWDEAREMQVVQQAEGLVALADAAELLDLSRQRIYQLAGSGGYFQVYEFLGRSYLSLRAVREFYDLERPTGRPKMAA